MRSLLSILVALAAVLALTGAARATEPTVGYLSVDSGRGVIVLEVRGVVLGRLTNGTITVTDRTPKDAYVAKVTGQRIAAQRRVGTTKLFVRGQRLRFSMLGGSYRIVIRGSGISLSVVGRGSVQIDGEPRFQFDDMGVYSTDEGVDCSVEPAICTPIADEPLRLKLEPAVEPPTPSSAR